VITIGSLCSGYGGLDMAAESVLGGRVVWHAENHPHAAMVLTARWPGTPNLGDITAVAWDAVAPVDVIVAGFPCQDISVAGHGAGIEGGRSGIWRNVAEAVRILRPALVFLENVAALRGRGLDRVVGDLAGIGYDAAWLCLRASDVGAPHQRNRMFLLAWPADPEGVGHGDPGQAGRERVQPTAIAGGDPLPVPDAEGDRRHQGFTGAEVRHREGISGRTGHTAADADRERAHRARIEWPGRRAEPAHGGHAVADPDGDRLVSAHGPESLSDRDEVPGSRAVAVDWAEYTAAVRRWEALTRPAPRPLEPNTRGDMRLSARFVEWMMGLPDGFVVDVPDLPRTAAFRILGNGVVPQQAAEALRLLLTDSMGEVA
jgi:DNA (cytosine-5)-methyltransferase 1